MLKAYRSLVLLFIAYCFASQTIAKNISAIENDTSAEPSGDYLQLGLLSIYGDHAIEGQGENYNFITIDGRLEYAGFFVEVTTDSVALPGFAIGYELYNSRDWSVDFVSIPVQMELIPDDFERLKNNNLYRRDGLKLSGIRATRFFDKYVAQAHILPLGRGTIATLALGRYWRMQNWYLSAFGSLRYQSETVNRRTWRVTPEEASIEFPTYEPSAGTDIELQVKTEYPLSEDWIFNASVRVSRLSDGVANSPIIVEQTSKSIAVGIGYVF